MYIKLKNGVVYDPVHGINGEKRDIYIRDGLITRKPSSNVRINQTYDMKDKIIMSGAIDIHTHIGGGKVNIARMMLPEDHENDLVSKTPLTRSGCGNAAPSTLTTGYRYAEMGYTACFEPAMLPANARQAHMEMADIPIVDKGAYAVLGNDDFLLRMLAKKNDQAAISDYVGWIFNATQALGIKVVNPGGINAFKFNQRKLELDELNKHYGVSPRDILKALTRAVTELGIPHPLHVHGCNLGVPGNLKTTIDTINAAEGMRMHLTHIQFHSYGTEGDRKFSSGAGEIAEAVNPVETLFVVDGMTGQDAVNSAKAFSAALTLTGTILTKLDGDARGGAAVSITEVTGIPIKFIGVSEKMDGLEVFDPKRIVDRILGFGDVVSLVEKAKDLVDEDQAAKLEKKLRNATFDLEDYKDQLKQLKKMGPLNQIVGMMPGMNRKMMKGLNLDDRQLIWTEAIISSMTPAERKDPLMINGSRRSRIAKGSGRSVQEVNQLLKQFDQMKKMMKKMGKMKLPRNMNPEMLGLN